jgi:hypothetical protein
MSMLTQVHAHLAEKVLLPNADAGSVNATNHIESQAVYGIDLVGPTLKNYWYQAETVRGPEQHTSSSWTPAHDAKERLVLNVTYLQTDCKACVSRTACTGQTRRSLTLQPQERMNALFTARQRDQTDVFETMYRQRLGIEGTYSQDTRTMGLRRSHYYGLHKTHLAHVAIATAMHVVQLTHWLHGGRVSTNTRLGVQTAHKTGSMRALLTSPPASKRAESHGRQAKKYLQHHLTSCLARLPPTPLPDTLHRNRVLLV